MVLEEGIANAHRFVEERAWVRLLVVLISEMSSVRTCQGARNPIKHSVNAALMSSDGGDRIRYACARRFETGVNPARRRWHGGPLQHVGPLE